MKYRFRKSGFINADPQVAGEVCEQLANENKLTAQNLVEVSRPEDAPLHKAFEWNDAVAAESWRVHQARNIINNIELVKEEVEPVRAFFNIEYTAPEYEHIETIMNDQSKTELLFARALNELRAFEKKYANLEAFRALFDEIHRLIT